MSNEKQAGKMWSGRFREPLDAEFEAWQRSIVFDWQLLDEEVAAAQNLPPDEHFGQVGRVSVQDLRGSGPVQVDPEPGMLAEPWTPNAGRSRFSGKLAVTGLAVNERVNCSSLRFVSPRVT